MQLELDGVAPSSPRTNGETAARTWAGTGGAGTGGAEAVGPVVGAVTTVAGTENGATGRTGAEEASMDAGVTGSPSRAAVRRAPLATSPAATTGAATAVGAVTAAGAATGSAVATGAAVAATVATPGTGTGAPAWLSSGPLPQTWPGPARPWARWWASTERTRRPARGGRRRRRRGRRRAARDAPPAARAGCGGRRGAPDGLGGRGDRGAASVAAVDGAAASVRSCSAASSPAGDADLPRACHAAVRAAAGLRATAGLRAVDLRLRRRLTRRRADPHRCAAVAGEHRAEGVWSRVGRAPGRRAGRAGAGVCRACDRDGGRAHAAIPVMADWTLVT